MIQKTGLMWIFLILSAALFVPAVAWADDTEWWSSDFSFRNVFSINSSLVDEDLVDFPVLVYLDSSVVEWATIQNDLDDLRFISSENELLDHEIDYYLDNDFAWIWVRIPEISNASDTVFFMYYGNVVALSVENAEAVWVDFVMVQHMNDETNSTILDSSSNNNDGTKLAANQPQEIAGIIGKAQDFIEGTGDQINCGADTSLNLSNFSAIAKIKLNASWNSQGIIVCKRVGGTFAFGLYVSAARVLACWSWNGVWVDVWSDIQLDVDTWYHVAISFDSSGHIIIFYINGAEHGGISGRNDTILSQPTMDMTISGYTGEYFDGQNDDLEVLDSVISVAWVGASYETQRLNLIDLLEVESYFEPYAERGEVLAAAVVASFILIGFVILILMAISRRR